MALQTSQAPVYQPFLFFVRKSIVEEESSSNHKKYFIGFVGVYCFGDKYYRNMNKSNFYSNHFSCISAYSYRTGIADGGKFYIQPTGTAA